MRLKQFSPRLFFFLCTFGRKRTEQSSRTTRTEKETTISAWKYKNKIAYHAWKYGNLEARRWTSKKYPQFSFKMARVVNIKLGFMRWCDAKSYTKISIVLLTKLYYFRKTRYFVWKNENFDEFQLPRSLKFLIEILHTFPTYQFLKKLFGIFFIILFRFWVIYQNKKEPVSSNSQKNIFSNNSRSKQNIKNPNVYLGILLNTNVCKISAKNIKLSDSWSSSKFSIIQANNLVSQK